MSTKEGVAATETASKRRKVLITVIVVAVLGSIAGYATYSAFSSSTTVGASSFTAGTVELGSNDAGDALYSLENQKPGDVDNSCIRVTYTGSLDSDVKLFTADSVGALGRYLNLTITPGTQSSSTFPSCDGFTPDGSGAIFNGTLQDFVSTHKTWATGLRDNPGNSSAWSTGDAVVYRFALTLADTDDAQGLTTGSHRFTFEARNQ